MSAEVEKSSYTLYVPRELLLDAGVIEPTEAERVVAERYAAEAQQQEAERKAKLDVARQRLAALTDPLARAVLDLHSEDERGECQGDDFDGYEAERPSWPCRTVEAVAEQYGIEL